MGRTGVRQREPGDAEPDVAGEGAGSEEGHEHAPDSEADCAQGDEPQFNLFTADDGGAPVLSLCRVSIGSLHLDSLNLKPGEWAPIRPDAL